jgi:hypothetical protein
MIRFKLLLTFLLLGLPSCERSFRERERGFREQGTYLAPKSNYRLDLMVQGLWDTEEGEVRELYKVAQICPLKPNQGRPARFTIDSQRNRQDSTFQLESTGVPTQPWAWESSASILHNTLTQAGFSAIDATETEQIAAVLSSGGAASPDLKAITVVKEASDRNYPFDAAQPHDQWVKPSELPPCKLP